MKKLKNCENGRSMVEMMGYLTVMIALVIALGKIVSAVFDNHRYSTAKLQLTELVTSVVKAAAIDVDYTDVLKDINGDDVDCTVTTSDEVKHYAMAADGDSMHLIPSSFRRAGTKLFHIFGGEVGICKSPITDDDGNSTRIDQFSVTFTRLSKKQCVELAMINWNSNQYVDLYAVLINDQYWWFWKAYGDDSGEAVAIDEGKCDTQNGTPCVFPMKRSALTGVGSSSASGQCTDSDENSITWVFN